MDYLKFLFIFLFSFQVQAAYVNDISAKIVDVTGANTATVLSTGAVVITPTDGYKATYSSSGTVTAMTAVTDLITIIGSATKTVRITRISLFGVQTSGSIATVSLIRRSTADVGGTATVALNVPFDTNNPSATAVVTKYTSNPTTLGTVVGAIRTKNLAVGPTTSSNTNPLVPDDFIKDFGTRSTQAFVLRGVAQNLVINLNGGTFNGNVFSYSIEWSEE